MLCSFFFTILFRSFSLYTLSSFFTPTASAQHHILKSYYIYPHSHQAVQAAKRASRNSQPSLMAWASHRPKTMKLEYCCCCCCCWDCDTLEKVFLTHSHTKTKDDFFTTRTNQPLEREMAWLAEPDMGLHAAAATSCLGRFGSRTKRKRGKVSSSEWLAIWFDSAKRTHARM